MLFTIRAIHQTGGSLYSYKALLLAVLLAHRTVCQPHIFYWPNEIEIIYIEKVELKIDIDMATIIAKSGDYFFINSEQLHLINSVDNKASLHHAIVFPPQILSSSYFDHCEINYIIPILNNLISFPTSLRKTVKLIKKSLTIFMKITMIKYILKI